MADYEDGGKEEEKKSADTAMSDEELQKTIRMEIEDAISFIDDDVSPQREAATQYFRGALFGDEQDGRSKVISRDVHDAVGAILPSILRIFFGPERMVEFTPQGEEDVEMAEQATDYVNYIVTRDNPGFPILYAAFKDALIRKCGFVKFWWDESVEITSREYSGLDADSFTKLYQDLESAEDFEVSESSQDESGLSVTLKIKRKKDRVCIAALPPEEFLVDRRARSTEEFTLLAHRRNLPRSELIAMGYKPEDVEDALEASDLDGHPEAVARQPAQNDPSKGDPADESQELVSYVEAYVRLDQDGDGIAELHKVCCVGSGYAILHDEIVEDHPFAAFPCDPEPHTFFGDSVAEKVMDIQKTKSGLLRGALDSLALSIHPRTIVKKSGVNIADVLNTEIGAIIRADDVSNVQAITTPFTGQHAFPMLEYMDRVREGRTGMSEVSMGLNPEALRNTTATAADNQFGKAHEHIEIIARLIAEVGMKRLFRGILKLVHANQRKSRVVNLRNKFVPVDPRGWKTDMDVTVNVALGAGTNAEKIATLVQVKQTQEQIIISYGPDNQLCGLPEYHNTLSKILSMTGFKNVNSFFKEPRPPDPNQPPPPPPPNPEMEKVKGEMQIKAQESQAKLQADQQRMQMQGQMDQQRHQGEMQLKQAQLQAELQLKREQLAAELQLKREQMAAELQMKRELGILAHQRESAAITNGVHVGGDAG